MSRRYAAKVDANQSELVGQLRDFGVSVEPLHAVGGGVPDLLCGFRGQTYLIEVKDGGKIPSKRKLTPDQKEWHASWRGQVAVCKDLSEALAVLGIEHRGQVS